MGSLPIFDEESEEGQGVHPPLGFTPGFDETSTTRAKVGGQAPQDLEWTSQPGLDEAPEVGKSGLMIAADAWFARPWCQ